MNLRTESGTGNVAVTAVVVFDRQISFLLPHFRATRDSSHDAGESNAGRKSASHLPAVAGDREFEKMLSVPQCHPLRAL